MKINENIKLSDSGKIKGSNLTRGYDYTFSNFCHSCSGSLYNFVNRSIFNRLYGTKNSLIASRLYGTILLEQYHWNWKYMERSCRYHLPRISLFLKHICNGNLSIAITDTNFLTKMQKEENQLNRSSPW